MYEHHSERLLPRAKFAMRVLSHFAMATLAVAISLGIGVVGYRFLGHLAWIDALLNASMILGGMGPVDALTDPAAKVFASGYSLFSGLFFIGILGVVLAPFAHRLMHTLHLDDESSS